MIRLFKPYVAPEAADAVKRVLDSGMIGQGPEVDAFERELGEYLGAPVAVVSSGTAALWLAYHLAGIKPGDRVVTSPLSCLASTETLLHFGAEIVWADVDPDTGMIDPIDVARRIDGGKAVVAVDWGGSLCDLPALRRLCNESGATLIEDAAHAFGAHYMPARDKYQLASVLRADYTAFSFQAIKMLTTCDGGALACKREADLDKAKRLRWFGLDRTKGASMRCTQVVEEPGYKFQMHDVAAAIGRANLVDVNERIAAHRKHAAMYDEAFASGSIRPLKRSTTSTAWLYTVRVPHAQSFITHMAERGVEASQVHARNDTQPMFKASKRKLPGMDVLERELVCLPVGWWLSDKDVASVIAAAREAVAA